MLKIKSELIEVRSYEEVLVATGELHGWAVRSPEGVIYAILFWKDRAYTYRDKHLPHGTVTPVTVSNKGISERDPMETFEHAPGY